MKTKILSVVATVSALGGLYLFGTSVSFLYAYLTDATSSARHEHMEGVFLSLMISTPFWVLVSALILPLRKKMNRAVYWTLNVPAIALCAGFAVVNIYVFMQAFSEKAI